MMYRSLKVMPAPSTASLPQETLASRDSLTAASSAIFLMEDFRHARPRVTAVDSFIGKALEDMRRYKITTLIAMDGEQVAGVITVDDIHGPKPVQFLHDSGCRLPNCRHSELKVSDVMTPVERLPMVRFWDLKRSRIGDVWETFESWKSTHLMVTDTDSANEHGAICGMIELARLEREVSLSPVENSVIMTRFECCHGFRLPRSNIEPKP